MDTTSFRNKCKNMLQFCNRNLVGAMESPMTLKMEQTATSLSVENTGKNEHSSVRALTADDHGEVKLLWRFAVVNGPVIKAVQWRPFLDANSDLCCCAMGVEEGAEAKMVGVALCGSDGMHCYLHQIAVDPKWNREVVGKALLDRIQEGAKQRGVELRFIVPHSHGKDITSMLGGLGLSLLEAQEVWSC